MRQEKSSATNGPSEPGANCDARQRPTLAYAQSSTLPGEFAFRTKKGFYLTAVTGGGRSDAPTIITQATTAGPWEKLGSS